MELRQIKQTTILRLKVLITAACLLSGLLAGGNIDRYLVQVPAWRHLDILNWREYSSHADLGNGLFVYPIEAIGGFLLLVASTITAFTSGLKQVVWPVCVATIFSTIGLIFTIFAAPIMLSLRTSGDDPVILRQLFDRFHYWGLLRAIAQLITFGSCIWASGKVFSRT
jgi:hypothetical protein